MPYLGDYLGHLLSEIATARVQADLETVRMAELYASHPLLKHLPVPRFRLPNLTLDVPVVVQEMEQAQPQPDISLLGDVSAPSARESVKQLIELHLQRAGIELSEREKFGLQAALDQAAAAHIAVQPFTPASARAMADDIVSAAVKFVGFPETQSLAADPARQQAFESELRAAALARFPDKPAAPPRLLVQVTNTALRDAGPAELMTRLRLSISEDAVEWTTVESQGQMVERLLPE